MRFVKWGIAIVVVIATVVGLAYWVDSTLPNSTKGITIVADNTARVAQGEDFVLTHTTYCGKSCTVIHVWHITFDGGQMVDFQEDGLLWFSGDHKVGTLCGVDCTTKVHMEWMVDMYATQRSIGDMNVVDVKWPWGWNYRPYRS